MAEAEAVSRRSAPQVRRLAGDVRVVPSRDRLVRLLLPVFACAGLLSPTVARAAVPDSAAPAGAPPTWLPKERWVAERLLPFDEARLYALIGLDRVQVHNDLEQTGRSLNEFAAERGVDTR